MNNYIKEFFEDLSEFLIAMHYILFKSILSPILLGMILIMAIILIYVAIIG